LCFELRIDPGICQAYLDHLLTKNVLIRKQGSGKIAPYHWDTRQFLSDSSTDRVRKHRKTKEMSEVKRYSNGDVTPSDTDSESDTDQRQSQNASAPAVETPEHGSYESDFRAGLLARGFGNPGNDPGTDVMIERTAAVCCQAGADPRLGAWMVVDLIRTQRCRGKPLEYLLGALRSQLSSPAHQNGTGLRKAEP
jgi:hypothetical protein